MMFGPGKVTSKDSDKHSDSMAIERVRENEMFIIFL